MQQAKRLMSTGINRHFGFGTSSPRRVYTIPRCATIVLSWWRSARRVLNGVSRSCLCPHVEPPSTTISCRVIWLARSEGGTKSCWRSLVDGRFYPAECEFKLLAKAANTLLFGVIAHPSVRCISVSVEPGETTLQRTRYPPVPARRSTPGFSAPLSTAISTHTNTRRVCGVGRNSNKAPPR